jgi:hypothetical protein
MDARRMGWSKGEMMEAQDRARFKVVTNEGFKELATSVAGAWATGRPILEQTSVQIDYLM